MLKYDPLPSLADLSLSQPNKELPAIRQSNTTSKYTNGTVNVNVKSSNMLTQHQQSNMGKRTYSQNTHSPGEILLPPVAVTAKTSNSIAGRKAILEKSSMVINHNTEVQDTANYYDFDLYAEYYTAGTTSASTASAAEFGAHTSNNKPLPQTTQNPYLKSTSSEYSTLDSKGLNVPGMARGGLVGEASASRQSSSTSSSSTTSSTTSNAITPQAVLRYYPELLSPYERNEILKFQEVYFFGLPGVAKPGPHNASPSKGHDSDSSNDDSKEGGNNQGFDDKRGDYQVVLHDHLAYRFEIVAQLGKGSFGQVLKCYDHASGKYVAIKMIRNKKRFEKQGLVELRVLDCLRKEDKSDTFNVVHMLDHFRFRGHLCIVFELMGMNLYEWLKAGGFKGIHLGLIRRFTIQMLQSLVLLVRNNIIHCDLKPENVLLRSPTNVAPSSKDVHSSSNGGRTWADLSPFCGKEYSIKVIDFGSSCWENEKVYTYVQSRFYRSPEVILGISYTPSIDMWSLGCILAELYTGYPLFPGENEQEQLSCIMEIRGVPAKDLIERSTRRRIFFDSHLQPRPFTNSKGKKRRPGTKNLHSMLKTSDHAFIDFIEKCLEWDPVKRMTPEQALKHRWIVGNVQNGVMRNPFQPVASLPSTNSNSSSSTLSYNQQQVLTGNHSSNSLPRQMTAGSYTHGDVSFDDPFLSFSNSGQKYYEPGAMTTVTAPTQTTATYNIKRRPSAYATGGAGQYSEKRSMQLPITTVGLGSDPISKSSWRNSTYLPPIPAAQPNQQSSMYHGVPPAATEYENEWILRAQSQKYSSGSSSTNRHSMVVGRSVPTTQPYYLSTSAPSASTRSSRDKYGYHRNSTASSSSSGSLGRKSFGIAPSDVLGTVKRTVMRGLGIGKD